MDGVFPQVVHWFHNLGVLLDLLPMLSFPMAILQETLLFHWLGGSVPPWQVMTLSLLFMAMSLLSWTVVI